MRGGEADDGDLQVAPGNLLLHPLLLLGVHLPTGDQNEVSAGRVVVQHILHGLLEDAADAGQSGVSGEVVLARYCICQPCPDCLAGHLYERLLEGHPPAREGDEGEGGVDGQLVAKKAVSSFVDPTPALSLPHHRRGLQGKNHLEK